MTLGISAFIVLVAYTTLATRPGATPPLATLARPNLDAMVKRETTLLPPELLPRQSIGSLDAILYELEGRTRQRTAASPQPELGLATLPSDPTAPSPRAEPPLPRQQRATIDTSQPLEPREVFDALTRPVPEEPNIMDLATRRPTPRATTRERFPGVFRVTVRTPVLSRPGVRGREVGELDAGDRVQVDGREGNWLRLRSRLGREGYIIAQDAEREDSAP